MPPRSIEVLFENRRVLAVQKPPRVLTVGAADAPKSKGPSLELRLRDEGRTVYPVHRLDFETSGIVLFALDPATADQLIAQFRSRSILKSYLLLLPARPKGPTGVIDLPIKDLGKSAAIRRDGKQAVTRWEFVRTVGSAALVRAFPVTGRHNQIRLHFAAIGLPLVGERKFARGSDAGLRHKRTLLHAESLTFEVPGEDRSIRLEAPLSEDFQRFMESLEGGAPLLRGRGER